MKLFFRFSSLYAEALRLNFIQKRRNTPPQPKTNPKSYLLLLLKNLREEFSESDLFYSCLYYFYLYFFKQKVFIILLLTSTVYITWSCYLFSSGWYLIYTEEEQPEEESSSKNEMKFLQSSLALLGWMFKRVFVLVHGAIHLLKNDLFNLILFFENLWKYYTWEYGCEITPVIPKPV